MELLNLEPKQGGISMYVKSTDIDETTRQNYITHITQNIMPSQNFE